jgi:hypothetical protein
MRPAYLRAVVVLATVIMGAMAGAAPGEARCLTADVILHWSHKPDQPVVTDTQCLVWTPFNAVTQVEANVDTGETQPGLPAGAYVEVWLPYP